LEGFGLDFLKRWRIADLGAVGSWVWTREKVRSDRFDVEMESAKKLMKSVILRLPKGYVEV